MVPTLRCTPTRTRLGVDSPALMSQGGGNADDIFAGWVIQWGDSCGRASSGWQWLCARHERRPGAQNPAAVRLRGGTPVGADDQAGWRSTATSWRGNADGGAAFAGQASPGRTDVHRRLPSLALPVKELRGSHYTSRLGRRDHVGLIHPCPLPPRPFCSTFLMLVEVFTRPRSQRAHLATRGIVSPAASVE